MPDPGVSFQGVFRGRLRGNYLVFNVGSGERRNLNEVIEGLRRMTGRPIKCHYEEARSLDVPKNVLDISLTRKQLS